MVPSELRKGENRQSSCMKTSINIFGPCDEIEEPNTSRRMKVELSNLLNLIFSLVRYSILGPIDNGLGLKRRPSTFAHATFVVVLEELERSTELYN